MYNVITVLTAFLLIYLKYPTYYLKTYILLLNKEYFYIMQNMIEEKV